MMDHQPPLKPNNTTPNAGQKSISVEMTRVMDDKVLDAPPLTHVPSLYEDLREIEADSILKLLLILIAASGVVIGYTSDGLTYYQINAIIMAGVYAQWLFVLSLELYKSNALCAIRVVNTKIEGFGFVTFPTQFIQVNDKPMESISEFAGVRGGTINLSTLYMSVINSLLFGTSLLQRRGEILGYKYAQHINEMKIQEQLNWQQIIILSTCIISAIGYLFVGYFESNNHSKIHHVMHGIGVWSIFALTIGFGMLVKFNALFICFASISIPVFVLYWIIVWNYAGGKKYKNNPKKVHFFSVVLILLEMVCIGLASCASVIVVYNLELL